MAVLLQLLVVLLLAVGPPTALAISDAIALMVWLVEMMRGRMSRAVTS